MTARQRDNRKGKAEMSTHAFTLKFDMDGADFDDNPRLSISLILKEIIVQVETGKDGAPIFDIDGKRIGVWSIE